MPSCAWAYVKQARCVSRPRRAFSREACSGLDPGPIPAWVKKNPSTKTRSLGPEFNQNRSSGEPCAANRPSQVVAGQPPLYDLQANVDVASRGVGIGAYLVCLLHQGLRLRARHPGQGDVECDLQAKATGRARPDTDRRGHRRIGRHFRAALRSYELHRADEAGRISGSEKLFGIIACAAAPTQFLWCGEFDVQRPIKRGSVTITAAGCLGAGSVKDID